MQGCRLAAATTSEFKHNDPVGWTEAHRGQIMRALYTLLLGNPFLRTPMGTEASTRFKIWWRMCGSAVENAAKQHTQWRKNEIAALERVFPPDRDDQWRQRRADIDSGIPSAQPKAIDFKELFLAQEEDDEESASLADVLAGMAAKQWTNSARGNVQPQANDIAKLINNPGSDYLAEADQQLAVTLRAVQRSIYDTHSEDGTDAAKGDAMASVCDIVNAIEAQDVGGERAQACKDAGIASDAAGVFCEATVADVVRAVLDAPVVADGLGALSGRQHDVTDEQCGFAG